MSQNNSIQHPEQQITPENLHASFQQLCFSYGALTVDKKNS